MNGRRSPDPVHATGVWALLCGIALGAMFGATFAALVLGVAS